MEGMYQYFASPPNVDSWVAVSPASIHTLSPSLSRPTLYFSLSRTPYGLVVETQVRMARGLHLKFEAKVVHLLRACREVLLYNHAVSHRLPSSSVCVEYGHGEVQHDSDGTESHGAWFHQ